MTRRDESCTSDTEKQARPGLARALAGPLVWAAAFLVLYVGHALACRFVGPDVAAWQIQVALGILWLLFAALTSAMVVHSLHRLRRLDLQAPGRATPPKRYMARLILLLDISAGLAVLATGLPLMFIPACADALLL